MDALSVTVSLWRRSSFAWGTSDCLMSLADHVRGVTGRDPGAKWRGRYDDEAGALAFLKEAGDAVLLLDEGLTGAGLQRVSDYRRGDVVACQIGEAEVGGLHTGDRVAFRMQQGAVEVGVRHVRILAGWRI